jgi:hypothetical protein
MLHTCPTARFVERLLSALNDPWGVITSECRWWPDPDDYGCSRKEGRDAVKLWNLVGTFYYVIGGKLSFVNIGGTSTRIKEEIADHLIAIIDICIASGPHCSLFSYFNRCYRTVENAQSRLTRHFWKLCVGLNIEWFFHEMVKDPMFPMITDLNNPEQGVRDWLSARRRIKAKIDAEKWNEKIALFQQYESANGNCDVPQNYKVGDVNLGTWVATQRREYQLYQKGQPSRLTEERIQQLNGLGFIWVVGTGRGGARAKADATKWDNQFRLLQQYKSVNGDCDVPRSHEVGDVNLGSWVDRQRSQYQLYQKGQPSQLTQERIKRLDDLGFIWVVGKGKSVARAKADATKWDNQFRLLQQYKSVNGNCEVPRSHKVGGVTLGTWVSNQRQQYQLFQKGQPSKLTDERIQRLNSLDFAWVLRKGGKRK